MFLCRRQILWYWGDTCIQFVAMWNKQKSLLNIATPCATNTQIFSSIETPCLQMFKRYFKWRKCRRKEISVERSFVILSFRDLGIPMPSLTPENYRIVLNRLIDHDPEKVSSTLQWKHLGETQNIIFLKSFINHNFKCRDKPQRSNINHLTNDS